LLLNVVSAWLFLRFFAWSYEFVPERRTRVYLNRFFFVGLLSIPLLDLITIFWLPRYAPSTGVGWLDELFYSVFSTGASEELAKFALFVFFAERWKSIREPRDGLLQAACVALAFATLENLFYMVSFGPRVMGYRLFMSMAGHIGFTALAGWAWATIRSRLTDSEKKHALKFSLGYIALGAMLHGLHNFFIRIDLYEYSVLCLLLGVFLDLILLKEAELSSPFRRFSLYEWREAARQLAKAAQKDPFDWISRERAGLYLLYGGNFRQAVRYLHAAVLISPFLPHPRGYLAAAKVLAGDEESVFALKLALFEMTPERRTVFERTLRKITRHAALRPRLDQILKDSIPAKPVAGVKSYVTPSRKLRGSRAPAALNPVYSR